MSIFFLLGTDHFLHRILIGIEEARIVQIDGLLPLVRHQMEAARFENGLFQFHLLEIAQASCSLIENEAGLRRNELTQQFRIAKVNFEVVHTEDALVWRGHVRIVDLLRSIIIRIVLDVGLFASKRSRRAAGSCRGVAFRWTQEELLASLSYPFISSGFVLNPFICSPKRVESKEQESVVSLPSFSYTSVVRYTDVFTLFVYSSISAHSIERVDER